MLREVFFKTFRILNADYFLERNRSRRLYVLMFHKVNDHSHRFYPAVPVKIFEEICGFFSKRFNVITFSEVNDYFKKSRKPAVAITFDDNHYDILENAYPILKRRNLRFNINIVTESIETGLPQNRVMVYDLLDSTDAKVYDNGKTGQASLRVDIDRNFPAKTAMAFSRLFQKSTKEQSRIIMDDIREKLTNPSAVFSRMLSKEDVKYLHKHGAEVGSHTHSHLMLPNIGISEAEYELSHSKKILEDLCGTGIDIIAYPNGEHNEAVIKKSYELGYKYILLTSDKINIIKDSDSSIFSRANLYYDTLDESLAKIFGFHKAMYDFKGLVKR
jgi:peptidoglycan/xylan/chitin deacetylase (PgdA/CDA1 family)